MPLPFPFFPLRRKWRGEQPSRWGVETPFNARQAFAENGTPLTRHNGRGGGGACSGCAYPARLKTVAVAVLRLSNSPATCQRSFLGEWPDFLSRHHASPNNDTPVSDSQPACSRPSSTDNGWSPPCNWLGHWAAAGSEATQPDSPAWSAPCAQPYKNATMPLYRSLFARRQDAAWIMIHLHRSCDLARSVPASASMWRSCDRTPPVR